MWLLWNATSPCTSFLSSWQCTEICTKTHFRTRGGFAVYLNAMWEWSPCRIYMHWSECCDKNWKPRMIASVLRGVAKFGLCTKFLLGLMPQRNWPRVDFLFFFFFFLSVFYGFDGVLALLRGSVEEPLQVSSLLRSRVGTQWPSWWKQPMLSFYFE